MTLAAAEEYSDPIQLRYAPDYATRPADLEAGTAAMVWRAPSGYRVLVSSTVDYFAREDCVEHALSHVVYGATVAACRADACTVAARLLRVATPSAEAG